MGHSLDPPMEKVKFVAVKSLQLLPIRYIFLFILTILCI